MCAGGVLPFRFDSVPVTLPLSEIVDRLNALAPPVAVTSTSETCTSELRAAISAGFGAPLIDSFGSTEGLAGASSPDDEVITFFEDGCIVELVDEKYRPVPPGTPSAAVLVTNLGNRIQPLIRYALTDSFVAQPAAAGHGYLRARVQGRCDDVFHYGEVSIHPLVIRSVLVRSPEVLEYQVHQTGSGIAVTAVTDHGLDVEALREHLMSALAGAGLGTPDVTVRAVPRLDRHRVTGTLRRFVPLH